MSDEPGAYSIYDGAMVGPGRPPLDRSELDPILDAVLRLAATSSSRSITFRQIATEAAVSVGKLQHHFGTRDELIREAFAHHLLAITGRLNELGTSTGDARQRISRLADEIAEHRSWQRATLWIDLLSRAIDSEEYRQTVQTISRAWLNVFEELIEFGRASGEFSLRGTVEDAAAHIVGVADGLTVVIVTAGEAELDAQRQLRRHMLATAIESAVGVRV